MLDLDKLEGLYEKALVGDGWKEFVDEVYNNFPEILKRLRNDAVSQWQGWHQMTATEPIPKKEK